jgi:hypothetical protein
MNVKLIINFSQKLCVVGFRICRIICNRDLRMRKWYFNIGKLHDEGWTEDRGWTQDTGIEAT